MFPGSIIILIESYRIMVGVLFELNTLIEHSLACSHIIRTVVEFYVINTATDKPYLASHVVKKLDESSVFRKLNDEFSIMGIETKGTPYYHLLHLVISSIQYVRPTAPVMVHAITTARCASVKLAGWQTHSAVYTARRG